MALKPVGWNWQAAACYTIIQFEEHGWINRIVFFVLVLNIWISHQKSIYFKAPPFMAIFGILGIETRLYLRMMSQELSAQEKCGKPKTFK